MDLPNATETDMNGYSQTEVISAQLTFLMPLKLV